MERTILRPIYFIKENMFLKCSRKDIVWFPRNCLTNPCKDVHTKYTHPHAYTCTPYEHCCFLNICSLISGCAGSSLLCGLSLAVVNEGYSSCSAWAADCGGLSCCRVQALGHTGFSGCDTRAWLLHGMRGFLG